MFSDAFPHKKVNDYIYEVYGRNEKIKTGIDERLIGGNASAEGAGDDEGVDDATISGIDIVNNFKLQTWDFANRKAFAAALKTYVKSLREYLIKEGREKEADEFKDQFQAAFKPVLEQYNDFLFWIGEKHYNDDGVEGMIVLQKWDMIEKTPEYPDGMKATFYFISTGLIDEKF